MKNIKQSETEVVPSSCLVEVEVGVGVEVEVGLMLRLSLGVSYFFGWVVGVPGGVGWLEKLEIKLSQLSCN